MLVTVQADSGGQVNGSDGFLGEQVDIWSVAAGVS